MAAWKKWWITIALLPQVIVSTVVILLWVYRTELWTVPINDWLHSPIGQQFAVGVAIYLIVIAIVTWAIAVFRPTTTKQMTIANDGANRVQIDRHAVEHSLKTSIAKYDLYNPDVKLKMHKHNQQADVTVKGMLSNRSTPQALHSAIQETIRTDLKQGFDIDLNRLRVNLKPYSDKETVAIV